MIRAVGSVAGLGLDLGFVRRNIEILLDGGLFG
jgi:hypothetical protein